MKSFFWSLRIDLWTKKNEKLVKNNHEHFTSPSNQITEKSKKRKNTTVNLSNSESSDQSTRRSTRVIRPYDKYQYDKDLRQKTEKISSEKKISKKSKNSFSDRKHESFTYHETIICPESRLWKTTIIEQLNTFIINQIWEMISRFVNVANVIIFKWVFKVKYTETNRIDRYKTRLIGKEFIQMHNICWSKFRRST